MGLSVEDVERQTLQSNTRTERQSDNFRKQFHLARHPSGRNAGKPGGGGSGCLSPFRVILKAMFQLQSSHLENGTICKKSEVFYLSSLSDYF